MASTGITRRLDRPGGRALLAAGASAYLTLKERRPCIVRRRDGAWVHRHGSKTIVESRVVLAPPEELARRVVELFLARYDVRPGDVAVDIGAGVGRETVVLAELVGPAGRVIAVEAHPATFAMLEATVAANGLTNVTAVHAAIGADDAPVFLTDQDEHTHNRVAAGATSGTEVPGRSLASLFADCDLDHVDFLKMNIEGAEGPALVAFGPDLARVGHASISCHDFVADLTGDETYRTRAVVQRCFDDAGFTTDVRAEDPRAYVRDTIYATAPGD